MVFRCRFLDIADIPPFSQLLFANGRFQLPAFSRDQDKPVNMQGRGPQLFVVCVVFLVLS